MAGLLANAARVLLPKLVEAGTGLLADLVRRQSPAAATVVERLGTALGVEPTPEAIAARYDAAPAETAAVMRELEDSRSPDEWRALERAESNRADLLKREDERESWFSWGWRPAMSWLLIFLWLWGLFLQPLTTAFGAEVGSPPIDDLLAFSGIWLAIYGGGHTLKSVLGKR